MVEGEPFVPDPPEPPFGGVGPTATASRKSSLGSP
jgi:hypothetical protein